VTQHADDRVVPVEGTWNFRDAGGLPTVTGGRVKRGVLFRSDALHRVTPAGSARLRSLGLRTVCDLRMPNERQGRRDRLPADWGIRRSHLPLYPIPGMDPTRLERAWGFLSGKFKIADVEAVVAESYRHIIRDQGPQLGRVLALVSDRQNVPVLVHCQGGKDRTGLVVAIVHLLLDVSQEQAIDDYLLTNQLVEKNKKQLMRLLRWITLFRLSPAELQPVLEARREHLEGALNWIVQRHGSLQRYLTEAAELPETVIASLRSTLLES
jgi:protein-tyrosine phosphatase